MRPILDHTTLRNIAEVISVMLSHKQIKEQFECASIEQLEGTNKADIVFNTLKHRQSQDRCSNNILAFLLKVVTPKRYRDDSAFERDRSSINEILSYEGIEISKSGEAKLVSKAKTIPEAKERSLKIKQKINGLSVHGEITPPLAQVCRLAFCAVAYLRGSTSTPRSALYTLGEGSRLRRTYPDFRKYS